jgi:hypothetical protein
MPTVQTSALSVSAFARARASAPLSSSSTCSKASLTSRRGRRSNSMLNWASSVWKSLEAIRRSSSALIGTACPSPSMM